jgi:hypothetical protein
MSKAYKIQLKYCCYSSLYSASGDIEVPLKSHACYADVLNRGNNINDEHYEIFMIRDLDYALDNRYAHTCFLSLSELKKHISLARRLFPFTYSVEEVTYQKYPAFKVNIDLSAPHFYHRYLTSWIRYAYEYPFNIILNDVLRMKHEYLPKESTTNLFVLCANTFYDGPLYYNTGHSISEHSSVFLKESKLKQVIKEKASNSGLYTRINSIYPRQDNLNCSRFEGNKYKYVDFWLDNEGFEERAKTYLANYKKMKKQ